MTTTDGSTPRTHDERTPGETPPLGSRAKSGPRAGIATRPHHREALVLWLTPGFGPRRIAALLDRFGEPERVFGASAAALAEVPGIGPQTAEKALRSRRTAEERADREIDAMDRADVRALIKGTAGYPTLLNQLDDSPYVLFVRGEIDPVADAYPLGVVGSRKCTQYGLEQSTRFAAAMARAGLTVVSGGARGVDSAAHRGALRHGGRTIAVMGCGLSRVYPPESGPLFDEIAAGRGAIVSELPMATEPKAEHFPARNRIISGLSLGVLVLEAAERSGALITARVAAEEHGREVFAVPGRVDSDASRGVNRLIRAGGAEPVIDPSDIIESLERPARHLHDGTHASRYASQADGAPMRADPKPAGVARAAVADPLQRRVLEALDEPTAVEALCGHLADEDPGSIRVALTHLELAGRVRRHGSVFGRVEGSRGR